MYVVLDVKDLTASEGSLFYLSYVGLNSLRECRSYELRPLALSFLVLDCPLVAVKPHVFFMPSGVVSLVVIPPVVALAHDPAG